MAKDGCDVPALVRSLGGAEEAARLADKLLRLWVREGASAEFGMLEPVVSARAAVNLVTSRSTDLTRASEAWLRQYRQPSSRRAALGVVRQFSAVAPKKARVAWPLIHERLSFVWQGSSRTSGRVAAPAGLPAAPAGLPAEREPARPESPASDTFARRAEAGLWKWPMLTTGDAATALGAKSSNRERIRSLRTSSQLLALPRGAARFLYPAFQFDGARRELRPVVAKVNQLLGAARDPWGVASWWVSPNGWLPRSSRPVDLLGKGRDDAILGAAQAAAETAGDAAPHERAE